VWPKKKGEYVRALYEDSVQRELHCFLVGKKKRKEGWVNVDRSQGEDQEQRGNSTKDFFLDGHRLLSRSVLKSSDQQKKSKKNGV